MLIGAHNHSQTTAVQRQRSVSRPQPTPKQNEIPRQDITRETLTRHAAQGEYILQGEYIQQKAGAGRVDHPEGLGFSVRAALETYAETASFRPRSPTGELVGVDLYI